MQISRRETLASAVAMAGALNAGPALSATVAAPTGMQAVQHLLVHADEADGQPLCASLLLAASDTAWVPVGNLDERGLRTAMQTYADRGYGLRRLNAFQARDGIRYAAIWQLGAPAPADVRYDMSEAAFVEAAARMAGAGYVLAHVDAAMTADGARFAAIWQRGGAEQKVFSALTASGYELQSAALAGFRVQQIAGYAAGGDVRFAVVFTAAPGRAQEAGLAVSVEDFPAKNRAMARKGYVLADASGYVAAGEPVFTAIWQQA